MNTPRIYEALFSNYEKSRSKAIFEDEHTDARKAIFDDLDQLHYYIITHKETCSYFGGSSATSRI